MQISEQTVAKIVAEISKQLGNARYVDQRIGELVQRQPNLMRYIVAYQPELGVDGVVGTLFHAAVLCTCAAAQQGRLLAPLSMADLDAGAQRVKYPGEMERFQPHLLDYLRANVELGPELGSDPAPAAVAEADGAGPPSASQAVSSPVQSPSAGGKRQKRSAAPTASSIGKVQLHVLSVVALALDQTL